MESDPVPKPTRNYIKTCSIVGAILAEVYMLFTALAPNARDLPPAPWDAEVMRVLTLAIFFGPFGAAAGLGVGLLLSALLSPAPRLPGAMKDEAAAAKK